LTALAVGYGAVNARRILNKSSKPFGGMQAMRRR
jgi:hypothetical protein